VDFGKTIKKFQMRLKKDIFITRTAVIVFMMMSFVSANASNLSKGQDAFFKNDYPTAISYFQKELGKKPKSSMLHFFIGQSYMNLKEFNKARTYFEKAVKIKPDYGLARLNLARVLYALGENKAALKDFSIVQKKHPKELKTNDKDIIAKLSKDHDVSIEEELVVKKAPDPPPDQSYVARPALAPKKAPLKIVKSKAATLENTNTSLSPKYVGVLIGIEKYDDPSIQDLDRPVKDIMILKNILTRQFTFNPKKLLVLKNPTRERIVNMFYGLSQVVTELESLLIFYAGHGHWDEKFKLGFWLPRDAKKDSRANWISNSTIRDYIRGIKSRHTLLIVDSCFSGGILKTRSAFTNQDIAVQELYKMPSRKAMTSGTLSLVPDDSVFVDYLLKRLKNLPQKYVTSQEIFNTLRISVINNSITKQVPQYGTIFGTGDEGGDFIFTKKDSQND